MKKQSDATVLTSKITAITAEEQAFYNDKANELAKKYGTPKVHVYLAVDANTNDRIVAYLSEPTFIQKLFALDKLATVGPFMAGEELRETLTLIEESDERTYSTVSEYDEYKLGVASMCISIVKIAANSFKKK